MATIGSLNIKLALQNNMNKGLDAASSTLDKFGKNVGGLGAKLQATAKAQDDFAKGGAAAFAKAGSAAADFAGGTASALTSLAGPIGKALGMAVSFGASVAKSLFDAAKSLTMWGASSAVALGKTARDLGASTEGVAELQYAAEQLGGSAEDVTRGLAKLNSSLSAAQFGSAALRDVLNRLGLDIDQLSKMSVDQAFYKVAASIGAVPDPTKRAAAASQLFGDSARAMLPLLSQGEKGLAKFADEARKMGLAISAQQASAVEDAFVISKLRSTVEGLARQLAVNLAPWINAVVDALGKMAGTGGDMAKTVSGAFEWVARSVAELIDGLRFVAQGFLYAEKAALMFVGTTTNQFIGLIGFMDKIQTALGNTAFNGVADQAKTALDLMGRELQAADERIKAIANAPFAKDKVDEFFRNVKDKMAALDKERLAAKTGGGSTAIAARNGAQFQQSLETIQQALTPMQQFEGTLEKVNQQLAAGAISFDTYARSVGGAVAQLEKAHQLQDIRMAGAVTAGSTQAYSAVLQSTKEADARIKEKPEDRVARVLGESKNIEERQIQVLREIARAVQQLTPTVQAILP